MRNADPQGWGVKRDGHRSYECDSAQHKPRGLRALPGNAFTTLAAVLGLVWGRGAKTGGWGGDGLLS